MKFYNTSEVATILGISKGTAVGLCNDGLLKAVNIGRCNSKRKRWRISEESLEAFVRDRANPTAKENASHMNEWGGPGTYPHYSIGDYEFKFEKYTYLICTYGFKDSFMIR